jgi:2-isopropylmalate synthase
MRPETVGLSQSRLVLGKHSGRHAFRKRLEELGRDDLDDAAIAQAFERFKRLADKKKTVTDADLEALVLDEFHQPESGFALLGVHVSCGSPAIPTASVSMREPDGQVAAASATGNGPVDAIFNAVNKIARAEAELEEYLVHAVSGGIDALGEVTVRVRETSEGGRRFSGHGADTDILVASTKAYVAAVNRMLAAGGARRRPKSEEAPAAVATA